MRQESWSWRRGLLVVACLAMVAVACGGDDDDSSGGDTGGSGDDAEPLVIAVGTEPSTLDVQAVNDRNARVFTSNVFESMLGRDDEAEIVPVLAESYESVDDSHWQFQLRDDVTFHNGEPFDAAAAAFSINRIIDPAYETQRTSYIEGIVGAEAVDEYTVEIETDGPNATLPIQMTQIQMVPPEAGAQPDFGENPVGTGPYEFVEWQRGTKISARAYADYWGEAPEIDEFSVDVIPDAQTALSALQAGEVDLVLDILPEQRDLAPESVSVPATEFSYIAFNTHIPELEDPRVRVAMNLAIDKELIAETIYGGEAAPQPGQMLTEDMLGYNADLEAFPYDPDEARDLLADAGYPDGFAITLNVPIGRYSKLEEAAEVVAGQLAEVGIEAELNQLEWNTFREDGRIPGTEAGAMDLKFAWNSNEWFDASRIISHITCDGESSKYCNPEVDDLMAEAGATLDQDARDELYQEVWATLDTSPHAVYLLQQNLIYGLSDRLEWTPRLDDEYLVSEMAFG